MDTWHTQPRRAAFLLALALLLAACGGPGAPANRVTRQQQLGRLAVGVTLPDPAQLASEQEVLVTLADAAGQPVDGAEVWLALIMPTMQMSPNEPDALAEGGGRYRARALFTMAGTWNLEVHATVAGQEYVARFPARAT